MKKRKLSEEWEFKVLAAVKELTRLLHDDSIAALHGMALIRKHLENPADLDKLEEWLDALELLICLDVD